MLSFKIHLATHFSVNANAFPRQGTLTCHPAEIYNGIPFTSTNAIQQSRYIAGNYLCQTGIIFMTVCPFVGFFVSRITQKLPVGSS